MNDESAVNDAPRPRPPKNPVPLGRRFNTVFAGGVGIMLAALFLAPMLWVALSSFKPKEEAAQPPLPPWPTSGVSLDTYRELNTFGNGLLGHSVNSFAVSIGTVLLTVAVSTLAGYGFSRFHFKGKNLLFMMIMLTMMVPFQSILTPLFLLLTKVGLQNSLFGLALVYTTLQLPFSVFMMRNSFDAVPMDIEEAARIDGCTTLSMLRHIMLNLTLPGIATVSIFAFLTSWNEFLGALVLLTNTEYQTLPVIMAMVRYGKYGGINWGAVQAGVTVMMIPCLILFLLLQRYYVRGLTAGAVK
ncbi:MAG: carbohydrate ABC transporter permease [Planctomycetes bacterium]|nr:carbohydrate ABC transporter permease [Planctomycetota bacterium]MCD7896408.1 carbohydrate ABC transporter permease [Planctomycetaceae bacterium]